MVSVMGGDARKVSIGSNGKWLVAPVQPAMEFARQTVYLKRLGEMYNDIKDLKKKINN